ncbi:GNAT family N-acetyltransferase [Actinopolymorpha sp. NPDC004070]|uniref:GNAT family N-acetyltransferase n=1 Tax=Actinopolymorpha sp. NPDC004070 TaxID=3154548 RepID=UPI0033B4E7F9
MTIEVRPLGDDAWQQAFTMMELSFGETWPQDAAEVERARFEPDRSIGAFVGDTLAGHAAIFSFTMTVPGPRALDVAGVSLVGVLPTDRRRGVLTALMRHQLHDLHESGREPVAVLTASEPAIYGRYGYGCATQWVYAEVGRAKRAMRAVPGADEVTIRYADPEKSLDVCAGVRDAIVPTRPGYFRHNEPWRRGEIADPESERGGASALRCVLAERGGEVTGFAYYRSKSTWEPGGPNGTTIVQRVHATDTASYAALWQFLADQDLMAKVTHRRLSLDDPLLTWLRDSRAAMVTVRDGMWARLVDVGRALSERRYTTPVDVVLEVRDDLCPWNAGRWHLAGDESGASCGRVDREPDLVLDVVDLGAAYFGRPVLAALGAAGLVEERTPGSLVAAGRAFTSDVLPLLDTPF